MDIAGLPARLDATLARGRAMAEARMTSRATVRRKRRDENGQVVYTTDPDGFEVPEWVDVYTDVPFRLDGSGEAGTSRGVTIGGVSYEQATAVGHFPAPSELLADDDLFEVTAGEWAGGVWRVVKATRYDQKTARRVPIAEEQRPEEWD